MLLTCSGDRVAVWLWRHYFGWGSASSAKSQGDRTWKPEQQTFHRAPEVVCAVECCSLRKANLRVSSLCYIAGATHGLPCTEVILCVVVCLFTCVRSRVIAVVPAVTVPVPSVCLSTFFQIQQTPVVFIQFFRYLVWMYTTVLPKKLWE